MEAYVGIIPAAGMATRLSPLPCSKELLPVGPFSGTEEKGYMRVASSWLIDGIKQSGISNIHVVIRAGKWDIPQYYQGGSQFGVNFVYHVTENLEGPPFSIDAAYPFCMDKNVMMGFPDMLFYPMDALKRIRVKFEEEKDADVVLGLFPEKEYLKWDMVELAENSTIERFFIKDEAGSSLKYAWFAAIWRPGFTRFVHDYLKNYEQKSGTDCIQSKRELQIGNLFQQALTSGLIVKGIKMDDVKCLDTGTITGYNRINAFLKDDRSNG